MSNAIMPTVFQNALNEFSCWANNQLAKIQNEQDKTIISPLYHYTNASGLKGIIESQNLWMTSYLHLNDPSELNYGIGIASRVVQEFKEKDGVSRFFSRCVDDLFTVDNLSKTFSCFISSFSRKANDLGQWRAYGDNGRGFSLGLDAGLFHGTENDTHGQKPNEIAFTISMRYGDDAKNYVGSLTRNALEKAIDIINQENCFKECSENKQDGRVFIQEMAAILMAQLIPYSLHAKDEAYEHEKEVRLLVINNKESLKPHIKTRIRNSKIIPYIEYPFYVRKEDNIKKIIIGPAAAEVELDGLQTLLSSHECLYPSIQIKRSQIPYRVT